LKADTSHVRLVWLCLISMAYVAATTIADDVAQGVFVTRLGAARLTDIFLMKAGIDVLAAALYVPLTRGRSPRHVWVATALFYATVLVAATLLAASRTTSPQLSAYVLYVSHECAWTLLVIHWGIVILAHFDSEESRRYFPSLFGIGRLGAIAGGLLVGSLSTRLGALSLLWIAAGLGLAAGAMMRMVPTRSDEHAAPPSTRPGFGQSWRVAANSSLVRMIAASTMALVVVRYGLRIVSMAELRQGFPSEDSVTEFLGLFSMASNAVAAALGLWVVPRFLHRFGIGVANVAYALVTFVGFGMMVVAPSIWAAALARFIDLPLKSSLKTPVSVLFYGGERPPDRPAARGFIFGVAIPAATIAAGLGLRAFKSEFVILAAAGAGFALLYAAICAAQNRSYRRALSRLLAGRLPEVEERDLARRGMASGDPDVRALAESLALETRGRAAADSLRDDSK
jgi:hypothetical protein